MEFVTLKAGEISKFTVTFPPENDTCDFQAVDRSAFQLKRHGMIKVGAAAPADPKVPDVAIYEADITWDDEGKPIHDIIAVDLNGRLHFGERKAYLPGGVDGKDGTAADKRPVSLSIYDKLNPYDAKYSKGDAASEVQTVFPTPPIP